MSDQIDTLYEQSGLDQTALTNGVTLATAGANETITIRDIQISNPGRTLDLKIGNTTILTNTGSTSYGGTEYIGPGQSLTLTYRAGTYPPAAQTEPNVYCNTFDFVGTYGWATYYYNDCNRIANTVLPWSNTSTYYGNFGIKARDYRHSSFPNYGGAYALWVPQTSSNHYIQSNVNWLYRYPGSMGSSQTLTSITYTTAWSGSAGAVMGACAYDGSRYIYGLSNVAYNNDSDNYWGYYLKLDTTNNSLQQIPFQADNWDNDFYDWSFERGANSSAQFGKKRSADNYTDSRITGQYLDGYYLVQPNYTQPYLLINTSTNTFRSLKFGKYSRWNGTNFQTNQSGSTYFAKSTYGDYIVAQNTDDNGTSGTAQYQTWDWWNIGPDLANPQVKNSGTFRQRYDDDYNYIPARIQGTRDPYNPSYYYVASNGNYNSYTGDIGTGRNSNGLTIVDFTYGYPTFRYIRCMNTVGFGNTFNQSSLGNCGYIIPSRTNYSWTAPATPAFGTVDVRVAGIRSSI